MVAIGILGGLNVATMLAPRNKLNSKKIANIGTFGILAGIVGARIPGLLFNLTFYLQNPAAFFDITTLRSTGVFYGGLLAAIGTVVVLAMQWQLPVKQTLDVFGPGIALGQAIGRLGCFLGGCCWGTLCEQPWAVTFRSPLASYTTGVPLNEPLHPTQLYEASLAFLIFCFTLSMAWKPHWPGNVFACYLILSGIARFVTEFFRAVVQPNFLHLPVSNAQLVSVGLVSTGIAILFFRRQFDIA